jgi:transcriptional regulator with XRE-family HTH domain
MNFAERFGRNLQAARLERGISQEDLGVGASLHRTAVGQLERGERVARTDTLVQLSGALGVEPQVLLRGLKWTPGQFIDGGMEIDQP